MFFLRWALVSGLAVAVVCSVGNVIGVQETAPANGPSAPRILNRSLPKKTAVCKMAGIRRRGRLSVRKPVAIEIEETRVAQQQPAKKPIDPPSVGMLVRGADGLAREKIENALKENITLDYSDVPLCEVVDFLKTAKSIPIVIDSVALDDEGLGSDTPVRVSVQDVSLRSALRIMLHQLKLTYTIHNDVLHITTHEGAENELETRIYQVADLAWRDKPRFLVTTERQPLDLLSELIIRFVAPDTWQSVGGEGELHPTVTPGCLAISQTLEVHERIEAFLSAIRRARRANSATVATSGGLAVPAVSVVEMNARTRIEAALDAPTLLEFEDAPLRDVVDFIKTKYKIPVCIDRFALNDDGLADDTLVSSSLEGISLRSALRIMLKESELTYTFRDEVLMITTPEGAGDEVTVCVYPVADLLAIHDEDARAGDAWRNAVQLEKTLPQLLGRAAWDWFGGVGDLDAIPTWNVLVVAQTTDVQEQVAGFLANMRRARVEMAQANVSDNPVETPNDSMVFKGYAIVKRASIEEVMQLIRGAVEPTSWKNGEAEMFQLDSHLLIRQTPAAHAKIEELLHIVGVRGNWPSRFPVEGHDVF